MLKRLALAAIVLAAGAAPALAHPDPIAHGTFFTGLAHPLTGLDHILAMLMVGLWAGTLGGKARWAVPGAFIGTMGLGFLFAASGVVLPFVQPMLLASVVALGLIVATAVRLPLSASAGAVALFALFHGYAHAVGFQAAELPFGLGLAAGTVALQATGLGLGMAIGSGLGLGQATGRRVARVAGGVAAAAGLLLAVGA